MNSRDAILSRIRGELAKAPRVEEPPVPEVWPRETSDPAALALRFAKELEAVQGEVIRCASMAEAGEQLRQLMDLSEWASIGAVDGALTRQVTAALPPERVGWVGADWQPANIAALPAGLLSAEKLLADTGTCVVDCATAQERLMCFLPPACVVIGRLEQLAEHLPAAWEEIARKTAEPHRRGEFVLITGPSRTADIEKILILGVHGPKRLVAILVD
jgi:L-lactate dehydrogenase complex protein LldG